MQQHTRTAPLFTAPPGSAPNAAVLAAQTAVGVGQAAVSAAMVAAAAAAQPGGWAGGGARASQQQQQQDEMPSELRIAAARAEKQKRMEVRGMQHIVVCFKSDGLQEAELSMIA
jgi:hypothetical protein